MLAGLALACGAVQHHHQHALAGDGPQCKGTKAAGDLPCAPSDLEQAMPQDTCPEAEFRVALKAVSSFVPGALDRAGGTESVVSRYLKAKRDPTSECLSKAQCSAGKKCRWPESQRGTESGYGVFVNLGEGSTGTRFLTCIFSGLGLKTAHDIEATKDPYCMGKKENCTGAWDKYDYLSDWPITDLGSTLMATHRTKALAGALLSLRDPQEWRKKRLTEHISQGSDMWQASAPCHPSIPTLGDDSADWDLIKLTYDSWSACIANHHRGHNELFAFNLWEYKNEAADFPIDLHEFLKGRGKWRDESLTLNHVRKAYDSCLALNVTKDSEWTDEAWFKVPRGNATTPTSASM
jgi:hypothetical protein